jgi:peptidoglycan/LPS O-acetylase OafA/YrhL
MRKLDSLQVGRAVAAISVLFFHITGLSIEYQHGCFYAPWTELLRVGVDVFFVISGVVMVITTYRKLGQSGATKVFLIHRISRIYPPYLALTVILTVFWFFHRHSVNAHSGGVDLFSSYTLWPAVGRLPLMQVGWTLSLEMMFYLIFSLIVSFVTQRYLLKALSIWTAFTLIGCCIIFGDGSGEIIRVLPRSAYLFSPYVLEFIAGCFIGLASLKNKLNTGKLAALIGILLFITEGIVFQVMRFKGDEGVVTRVLLFGPPAVLFVSGLVGWELKSDSFHPPNWIVRCGNISYSIYLVHLLVIHSCYRYAWRLLSFDERVRPFFIIISAAAAIAVGMIFFHLIEKPFSRHARLWLEDVFRVPVRRTSQRSPVDIAQ